jgi:acetate kinase
MRTRGAARRGCPPPESAMDTILVVNAGSSSVKLQVFELGGGNTLRRLIKAQIDGIGTRPRLHAQAADQSVLMDQTYGPEQVSDVGAALGVAAAWLREAHQLHPAAVGHRIVHGGPEYDRPVLIDRDVLAHLERYVPLAPLHQPNNLAPVRSLLERAPQLPQVACFDTSFHRGHSAIADHYALPERFYVEGVRRYGFHGLSYEYIAGRLPQVAPEVADGRVIVAHLGSGASMCALLHRRSIECTMGFTALDGVPMGTRPGQLDPGVVLYLLQQQHMSPDDLQDFLYGQCGLQGLSGVSNDVRELEASSAPAARFALEYFVYRVRLEAGMLAAALGGLDGFVFTAGIGENSARLREEITEKLTWLGAVLDPVANSKAAGRISRPDSRLKVYIVPTDEELMIARHTVSLIATRSANSPGNVPEG